jgi:hypothetical protein
MRFITTDGDGADNDDADDRRQVLVERAVDRQPPEPWMLKTDSVMIARRRAARCPCRTS